jgi:hypothetical protein
MRQASIFALASERGLQPDAWVVFNSGGNVLVIADAAAH